MSAFNDKKELSSDNWDVEMKEDIVGNVLNNKCKGNCLQKEKVC
jgi:hypothetical protein